MGFWEQVGDSVFDLILFLEEHGQFVFVMAYIIVMGWLVIERM